MQSSSLRRVLPVAFTFQRYSRQLQAGARQNVVSSVRPFSTAVDTAVENVEMEPCKRPPPLPTPIIDLKEYFDVHLHYAMKNRQKEATLSLFHEYLQHLNPAQVLTNNQNHNNLLLLSPHIYASFIYTQTPHDLHGAILAFFLYQKSSCESNDPEKTGALFKRILRSISSAAPLTSRIYTCYCPFFYSAYPMYSSPQLLRAKSLSPPIKKLFAVEMFMAVDTLKQFVTSNHLQQQHIPQFVAALLAQKFSTTIINEITLDLWIMFKNSDIEIDIWCENILKCSSYRRQDAFPFGDVLLFVIDHGRRPSPNIVLQILQNEFPFDNVRLICKLIKAILHLQRTKKPTELDYRLDIGTLQHISSMAARRRSSELIHILWDYFDELKYGPPTEALYEDTIVTLIESRQEDESVLDVLAEMQHKGGYTPQRPLIRSVSRSIRPIIERIQRFARLIKKKETEGDGIITIAMFHCVLSAYAEWGMVDSAFQVFDDLVQMKCVPDDHTFSYLMEAVAVNTTTAIEANNESGDISAWAASQLDSAEVIALTMNQMNCSWNQHSIHHYVRILCAVGQLIQALSFVTKFKDKVSLETFGLLATSFALKGQRQGMEGTIEVCRHCGHSLPIYTMERLTSIMGNDD